MRTINKNIISVVVSGDFVDINNRIINYRVLVKLPNCVDEWLLSNITNRYLFESIRNCQEYNDNGKFTKNEHYADIKAIKTARIEWTDKKGKSLITDTGQIPTFYGKSIFDFTYMELQDFATAFGIHEIKINGEVEELQKQAVVGYLTRIKKMTENDIRNMSFFKYDKTRMKHYIDFDEKDKQSAIVNKWKSADKEEFLDQDNENMDTKTKLEKAFKDEEEDNNNEDYNREDKEYIMEDTNNNNINIL